MLKHFFARSSSTSATVKKNETRKTGTLSPPTLEPSVAATKENAFEVKKEQNNAESEHVPDKPVTAYGYEDSSYEDGRRPLEDFTDSPKIASKSFVKKDNFIFNQESAKIATNLDGRTYGGKMIQNIGIRNNDSPNFNESSIAPVDISLTQINDQKIIFNDLKNHNDSINEYLDEHSQGTKQSSNTGGIAVKTQKSTDSKSLNLHLDLSSILLKREMEQKGKPIYRISRSNSKSPVKASANHQKSKTQTKHPQGKQSTATDTIAFNTQTINHAAKISISDKKNSQIKEHISAYLDGNSKQDADKKMAKRRTKEERISSAMDLNQANQVSKKQSKASASFNVNITPKNEEKKSFTNSIVKSDLTNKYIKESLSPKRESLFERQKIKPYSKQTQPNVKQRVDYSDPVQVKKAFDHAMQQTIEKNNKEIKKKESKIKKKVNIIDYNCNSPTIKPNSRYADQASDIRTSVKKYSKQSIINTSPKKGSNVIRDSYVSSQKQSSGNIIGQTGGNYLKRQRDRNQINQLDKKKTMNSNLYYGVIGTGKKDQKQKSIGKKSTLKERQKKAAQDRANRPWNLNQSYISHLSLSPQRRLNRKGTSLVKSRSSLLTSTFGVKGGANKKYRPNQFGTKSQFGTLGRSMMGNGNRFGFQNNLARNLRRSSTISTFQPKFGRSTIGGGRGANSFVARENNPENQEYKKTLEWKRQIAAKYNNFMRTSKSSVATQKKGKYSNILTSSPVTKSKNASKRGESALSVKQSFLNNDQSLNNLQMSSKRKVSIKAKLQMLRDDDLLPDQDLYKFPTIGQISKMSPIGTFNDEQKLKNKKKKTRNDEQTKSQDFLNKNQNPSFLDDVPQSHNSIKQEDIIIEEEPKSSGEAEQKKQSNSSQQSHKSQKSEQSQKSEKSQNPLENQEFFESKRDDKKEEIQMRIPSIQQIEAPTNVNTVEKKLMSSQEFLDGLRSNSLSNVNTISRSFADLAREQKQKEDEDLFNNLMEGDGKMGSNRMALADEEEFRSRGQSNSQLGFNSAHQNSVSETMNMKFTEPLNSPVFHRSKEEQSEEVKQKSAESKERFSKIKFKEDDQNIQNDQKPMELNFYPSQRDSTNINEEDQESIQEIK